MLSALGQAQPSQPQAIDGSIDLSRWNSATDPFVNLQGSWRFYWQRMDSEADLATGRIESEPQDGYIKGPGTPWTDVKPGSIEPFGYATYVLEIKGLNPATPDLAMVFSQFANMHRSYIYYPKSKTLLKVAEAGVVGKTRDTSVMQDVKRIAVIPLKGEDRLLLIQQVASYRIMGGMGTVPTLGDTQRVLQDADFIMWQSWLVIGMFALLVISNVSLFVLRPEDKPSLVMAIFTLVMLLRFFGTEGLWPRLFPEPHESSFVFFYVLMAFALPLGLSIYLSFFYLTFRGQYPRWALIGAWATCTFYAAHIALGFAIPTLSSIFSSVMLVMMIFGILMFIRLIRITLKGTRGAALSLVGITLLVGAMANDVFVYLQFYSVPYIGHYGMITFIFAQSLVVASNFAHAFRTAEKLSRDLQLEVERQTRDVKTILANIHQGILTVREGLLVGDDYSSYLEQILGTRDISHQGLIGLVFQSTNLSNEQKAMIESVMTSSINESLVNFEMNTENLPREFVLQKAGQLDKVLIADWEPVTDSKTDRVEKVLVTLRDVTELKQMEAKNTQQQREMELISEIIEIPTERFAYFMEASHKFLSEVRRLLNSHLQPSDDSLRIVFINYHTMKGAARTYHFSGMTSLIHDAENTIAQIQKAQKPWNQQLVMTELSAVEVAFAEYQRIHTEKLRRGQNKSVVSIELETVRANIRALDSLGEVNLDPRLTPFVDTVRRTFYQLYYLEFDKLLAELTGNLPQLARDLQKNDPIVEVHSIKAGLTKEASDALRNVFVHIFRNIMDHGLEGPEERKLLGKNPTGCITITSSLTIERALLIRVQDDGRGIKLDHIHEMGVQKKLIGEHQQLKPSEVAELVFLPGFSTAKGLTDVSGRGVGMSAVREYVEQEGGSVHITLLKELGFLQAAPFALDMILPPSAFTIFETEIKVA